MAESALCGYSTQTGTGSGCLTGFVNSWAFKVQSSCFVCFCGILESDNFARHPAPCCQKCRRQPTQGSAPTAAPWSRCLACLVHKRTQEVPLIKNWLSKYLKRKWNILIINLLKYKLKIKLSELWLCLAAKNCVPSDKQDRRCWCTLQKSTPLINLSVICSQKDAACSLEWVWKQTTLQELVFVNYNTRSLSKQGFCFKGQ